MVDINLIHFTVAGPTLEKAGDIRTLQTSSKWDSNQRPFIFLANRVENDPLLLCFLTLFVNSLERDKDFDDSAKARLNSINLLVFV